MSFTAILSCPFEDGGHRTLIARGVRVAVISYDAVPVVYTLPGTSVIRVLTLAAPGVIHAVTGNGSVYQIMQPRHGAITELTIELIADKVL